LIELLASCGAPISNDVLIEDAAFAAALPDSDRLAAPGALRTAAIGDSAVLQAAVDATVRVEALGALAVAAGEALAAAAPDVRSAEVRSWDAVATAAQIDGVTYTFFARGEVAEPLDGGDLDWQVELATEASGPWVTAGTGRHDPGDGTGDLRWDFASLPVAELSGSLDASYVLGPPRQVELVATDALDLPTLWTLQGSDALGWTGSFAVTSDGATWPGSATATATRADGRVDTADGTLAFSTCWSAAGDTVWTGGDDGIGAVGAEAACAP
jgi:hypothetical protein